jgi:uncharacterized membrane protein
MDDTMRTSSTTVVPVRNMGIGERWASIIGGGMLLKYGLGRGSVSGVAVAALGGNLIYNGVTGYSPIFQALGMHHTEDGLEASTSVPYELGVRVDKAITINRPRHEVYSFWRNFENLSKFMRHLHSVTLLEGGRSHWIAQSLGGKTVEWDAEVNNEVENEVIGWRSLPGSDVDSAGSVRFQDAPGGRGTEVRVSLQYNPPGGAVGAAILKVFGKDPARQIQEDLRRLKQLLETGEIATTEGQPHGGESGFAETAPRVRRAGSGSDRVEAASEESFPASDPPSWTAPVEKQPG